MAEPTEHTINRHCVRAVQLALAIGIIWGLCMFIMSAITIYTASYGHEFVRVFASVYPGYGAGSWMAASLGLVWGFLDGLIGTLLVVGLYRLLGGCK